MALFYLATSYLPNIVFEVDSFLWRKQCPVIYRNFQISENLLILNLGFYNLYISPSSVKRLLHVVFVAIFMGGSQYRDGSRISGKGNH